jgi:uncharacterized RDD family membrane protein YckC
MDDQRTWYEVLGVEPRAAKGDIKTAYQQALDTATVAENGDEVAQVRRAWQVLSDPVQRQRYDEGIGVHTGALEPVTRNGDGRTSREQDVDDDEDVDDDGYDGSEDDVEVLDDGEGPPIRRPQQSMMKTAAFLELPTLGRRLVATIIDAITFLALAVGGGIPLGVATGSVYAVLIWVELMVVGVYIVPTIRTGQTLGKRMTYLMTVERASGGLLTWRQAVIRYIVPMAAIPLLPPIGVFLALYFGLSYMMGRDQVSLADRLAKSIVVIARYKPSRQSGV